MRSKLLIAIGFYLSFFTSYAQLNFVNNALGRGINYSTGSPYLGSGVSFVDFDNDGWDDISFASGNGQNLRFYKNNAGTFTAISLIGPIMHETKQINCLHLLSFLVS